MAGEESTQYLPPEHERSGYMRWALGEGMTYLTILAKIEEALTVAQEGPEDRLPAALAEMRDYVTVLQHRETCGDSL